MEENDEKIIDETFNRSHVYIPKEYQRIDWQRSWKKCRCGKTCNLNANWCPSCGQHLGRPPLE